MRAWLERIAVAAAIMLVPAVANAPPRGAMAQDAPASTAPAAPIKRLVIMSVELEGDFADAARAAEWAQRGALVEQALRQELDRNRIYRVVDNAPAADVIARLGSRRGVHDCQACVLDVARRLGGERVLVAWVFRMSNLILTLHVEVRDVATGDVILKRVLSFRGDNDRAWLKAVDFLVRDLKERSASEL